MVCYSTGVCLVRDTRVFVKSKSVSETPWDGLLQQGKLTILFSKMPTILSSMTLKCNNVYSIPTPTPSAIWSPPSWKPMDVDTGTPVMRTSSACKSYTPKLRTVLRECKCNNYPGRSYHKI